MSFHTVALTEGHVTYRALVGLLSGVDPHVGHQTGLGEKLFAAFAASMRLLSGVVFQVSLLLMFCMKLPSADVALVRSLLDRVTRVPPHVLGQTFKAANRFIADAAVIRLLASVFGHVNFEV